MELRAMIEEAAAAIRAKTALVPEICIILGTGLDSLAASIEDATIVPYGDIDRKSTRLNSSHT